MDEDILTRLRDFAAVSLLPIVDDAVAEIERLRSELDAEGNWTNLLMLEIQRLRAAGDHLVRLIFSSTIPSIDSLMEYLRSGIDAWEEVRRG